MREHIPFWSLDIDTFKASATESSGYMMHSEHAHHHHEVMFNFSRIPTRHAASGKVRECDSPYILYRAPYTLHSSSTLTTEKYRRYLLAVQPTVLTAYDGICSLGKLKGQNECLIPVREDQLAMLEPLLYRLWWANCDKSIPDRAWIGTLSALLYEIDQLVPDDLPPARHMPPYIQEMMYYIIENTGEDLSIETLSDRYFISRSKLLRDFFAATGQSMHRYIIAIRIAHAKRWLAEGVPISIVAQRCGYSQESAFIYMFRRETGVTPGEYLKG